MVLDAMHGTLNREAPPDLRFRGEGSGPKLQYYRIHEAGTWLGASVSPLLLGHVLLTVLLLILLFVLL